MRFLHKKEGFTLVELLVVIAVGSLVSFAATSILLFAMRFYRINLDTVEHQGILRIMLTVVENMSSEGEYSFDLDNNAIEKGSDAIIHYDSSAKQVVTGTGAVLMENVDGFDIKKPTVLELYDNAAKNLYSFTIDMDGQTFDSTVYSRTQSVQIADANYPYSIFPHYHQNEWEADDPDLNYESGRNYMVSIAASQIGSTGRIKDNPSGFEDVHYNLWYLNREAYGDSGWSDETAWCSVFASWVIDRTKLLKDEKDGTTYQYLNYENNNPVPKAANVNHLWMYCYLQSGNMSNLHVYEDDAGYVPNPGDLIFFMDIRDRNTGENLTPLKNLNLFTEENLEKVIGLERSKKYIRKASTVLYKDKVPSTSDLGNHKELYESGMIDGYEEYSVLKHFLWGDGNGLEHVGIVAEVKDGYVYTIEGNVEVNKIPTVVLRKYPLKNPDPPLILDDTNSYQIYGYATLNWNPAYK